MVFRAQGPLGTIAQFFHLVAEEKKKKKKDDKKTRVFYDWATTGIPVIPFNDKRKKFLNGCILQFSNGCNLNALLFPRASRI